MGENFSGPQNFHVKSPDSGLVELLRGGAVGRRTLIGGADLLFIYFIQLFISLLEAVGFKLEEKTGQP